MFTGYTVDALYRTVKNKLIFSPALTKAMHTDARASVKKIGKHLEQMALNIDEYLSKADEMKKLDDSYRLKTGKYLAGVDEVGRGPLAGPVVAACVIFPKEISMKGVRDSKQLSQEQREELFCLIYKKALGVGVGLVSAQDIDTINIQKASLYAMALAVERVKIRPEVILVDGQQCITGVNLPQFPIVDGDDKSLSIAAASIVAKVTRDWFMSCLDRAYPQYQFKKNKGYGTAEHFRAIEQYGICPIHRLTFLPDQFRKGI